MRRKPLYCIAPSPAYVSRGCLALPSNYGSSSSSSQPRTSRCGIQSLYFRTGVTEVLARFALHMLRVPRLLHHLGQLTCTLLTLLVDAAHFLWLCLHSPTALAAEHLFLRKQLARYQ